MVSGVGSGKCRVESVKWECKVESGKWIVESGVESG